MRIGTIVVLGGLLAACGMEEVEEDAPQPGGQQEALLVTRTASYTGSILTLGATKNDASWFVNMSNSLVPMTTQLTTTITHGGSLQNGLNKLGHIAISIRGGSAEGGFAQMGLPLLTGTQLFGEDVNAAYNNGQGPLSRSNLYALISGRGITFWPVGTPGCPVANKPCAIFENYTSHALFGGGLMSQGVVALDVSEAPFTVSLSASRYNTTAIVTQNGVQKLNVSCRAVTGDDSRCGDTAGNVGLADAWVAFVAGDAPVMQGYRVGATSFTLTHTINDTSCPTCPIP